MNELFEMVKATTDASMASFKAGFESGLEAGRRERMAQKPFDVKAANEQMCVEQGHVFPKIPVKECIRCHAQFAYSEPTRCIRGQAGCIYGDSNHAVCMSVGT